jgi:hypothetical protein
VQQVKDAMEKASYTLMEQSSRVGHNMRCNWWILILIRSKELRWRKWVGEERQWNLEGTDDCFTLYNLKS